MKKNKKAIAASAPKAKAADKPKYFINNTVENILVAVIFFLLGAGAMYYISQSNPQLLDLAFKSEVKGVSIIVNK